MRGAAASQPPSRRPPPPPAAARRRWVEVFEYTGDPNDPVGDFISETLSGLHGPHPDLLSGFSLFCDVLGPYLQDP